MWPAWVAGGTGIVLVGGLVALALSGGAAHGFSFAQDPMESQGQILSQETYNGTVRLGASQPAGSHSGDETGSTKAFTAPPGADRLVLNLTWDPQSAGADDLRIIVEIARDGAWQELGRQGGPAPVLLTNLRQRRRLTSVRTVVPSASHVP